MSFDPYIFAAFGVVALLALVIVIAFLCLPRLPYNLRKTRQETEDGFDELIVHEYLIATEPFSITFNEDGALTTGYRLNGPDATTKSEGALDRLVNDMNAVYSSQSVGWMYEFQRVRKQAPAPEEEPFCPTATHAVLRDARANNVAAECWDDDVVLLLTYLPPEGVSSMVSRLLISQAEDLHIERDPISDALRALADGCRIIEATLRTCMVTVHRLKRCSEFEDELVNVLFRNINGWSLPFIALPDLDDTDPETGLLRTPLPLRERLAVQDFDGALWPLYGREYIRLISLSTFPAKRRPQLLKELAQLAIPYRDHTRLIVGHPEGMLTHLQRRFNDAADDATPVWVFGGPKSQAVAEASVNVDATKRLKQIQTVIGEHISGERLHSWYSRVIEIRSESLDDLDRWERAIAETLRVVGFGVRIEDLHSVEAWLSTLGSNGYNFVRRTAAHGITVGDLSNLTDAWRGRETIKCDKCEPGVLPMAMVRRADTLARFALDLHAGEGDVMSSVVVGPIRFGKALEVNTPVLTPTGYKQMGKLRIGDAVIGKNGRPTTVNGVFPQGQKAAFRVTFSDGASTVCCDEHLWQVSDHWSRNEGRPDRVLTLAQIREKMASTSKIYGLAIPTVDPIQFPYRDLPLDPYVLGALIGDGTLYERSARFTSADADLVASVSELLPTGTEMVQFQPIDYRIRASSYNYSVTPATDDHRHCHRRNLNDVVTGLQSLGLSGKKSYEKFIPDEYKFAHVDARVALLQGLLDTDGSPVNANGRGSRMVEYTTTSRALADDVVFLTQSLGGLATFSERTTSYIYDGERKQGRTSYRVHVKLPAEIAPFRLQRKLDCHRPATKYKRILRRFSGIEAIGEREMVCISVESADGLFVVEDCIVTHNTTLVNFIIGHFRKTERDRVVGIDYLRGEERTAVMLGGAYGAPGDPMSLARLCPFIGLNTVDGRRRAVEWCELVAMLNTSEGKVSGDLLGRFTEAVDLLRSSPTWENEACVTLFLQKLSADKPVKDAFRHYAEGGIYGHIFDATPNEMHAWQRDIRIYDTTVLHSLSTRAVFPALVILCADTERQIDGRRMLLVIEEAHIALKHPWMEPWLITLLRTNRKKHLGIIFVLTDLEGIAETTLRTLKSLCGTVFATQNPNVHATRSAYQFLGFDNVQIQQLVPSRVTTRRHDGMPTLRYQYWQLGEDGVAPFVLDLSPEELETYARGNDRDKARTAAALEHHPEDVPAAIFEAVKLPDAAEAWRSYFDDLPPAIAAQSVPLAFSAPQQEKLSA
jgi:hypothetical protein